LLALLGCTAHAADTPPAEASTAQVTARLLAPVTAVRPGQVLTVGLQQRIAPHWHTYWVNPGDSGLATTIAWALPTGAQAGPIVWPLPQRFVLGDIVNYGYADEAVLLQSLQVPASLRDGETFRAQATVAVFLSLGFGLALPYLLLCYWPALQRRLPRSGAWMERLKHALAFPMHGTAAWLVWVLAQQAGAPAVALALGSAVVLGFAAWLHAQAHQVSPLAGRVTTGAAALVAGVAVGAAVWGLNGLGSEPATASATAGPASAAAPSSASHAAGNGWEPYTPERLQALRSEGKPVFVNLTAAWCLTCLVNERVALGQPQVDAAFEAAGITRLKGDWTRPDERITRLLAQHGRDGVPLYLLFPAGAGRDAVVLPQVLTPDTVLAALAESVDSAKGLQ
jgi:hypothetical protein